MKTRIKKVRIIVISILVLCLLAGGIAAAVIRTSNSRVVTVIPVSSLNYGYYDSESTIEGTVSTRVTQKVELDSDSIVEEVFVSEGDHVSAGDKLMSYDTTLNEMELEIMKLTRQLNKRKLAKAKSRLEALQSGASVEAGDFDPDSGYSGDSDFDSDSDSDDSDEYSWNESEKVLAVSLSRAVNLTSSSSADESVGTTDGEDGQSAQGEQNAAADSGDGQAAADGEDSGQDVLDSSEESLDLSNVQCYAVLDGDSVSYTGTGTAEDPYRYLCDADEETIVVKGSFLNMMAGYSSDGSGDASEDAPYWYRLEFHEDNRIADAADPESSLLGYYVRKGAAAPCDPDEEKYFAVGDVVLSADDMTVLTPTPEPDDSDSDSDSDSDWDSDSDSGTYSASREEAIKALETRISNLELTIKSNKLKISELKTRIENQTVTASIDGTVTVVGDVVTGESDGDAFIEVESDEGVYIEGAVSELKLDQVQSGQVIVIETYDTGDTCQAEIREISQFPSDDDSDTGYYYYYSSNSNVSWYPFMAEVLDEDVSLEDGDSVSVTIPGSESEGTSLNIEAAFVRSEDGVYYVYKDENGRLVKQIVNATKSSDGYSYKITSGITSEDMLAFPYGSAVKEGARTQEGSYSDLWGY